MRPELPADLMEMFSQFIEDRVGLHFPRERWRDLERALHTVAPELAFDDAAACAQWLMSKSATRDAIEVLVSRLTVGETYFFRDPKAFDALTTLVLPELIHARRPVVKRLRIWSAGCCSGEEPYSIAIALSRLLPELAEWEVTILGTDINPNFLRKAEAGIYNQWSFRGVSDEIKSRYFQPTPEGRFAIIPEIRKLVAFECLNLAEDVYPTLLNNTNAMDIIFCRNVLMYFSRDQARKAAAGLHRSLVADGWLFPGGPEASRELFGAFHNAEVAGTIVFRKTSPSSAARPLPATETPEAISDSHFPADAESAQAEQPFSDSTALPSDARAPQIAPEASAKLARHLANEGRLNEALAACDRALDADKLAPSHHYLRGLILDEQGAHDEAAIALRRALYLDHDFVVAHLALGNLLRRQSRKRDAERCFENARALLRRSEPAAIVPESDGLTSERLLTLLEANQESMA